EPKTWSPAPRMKAPSAQACALAEWKDVCARGKTSKQSTGCHQARLSQRMGTSRQSVWRLWNLGCRRVFFSCRPHRNSCKIVAASSSQRLFKRDLKSRARQLRGAFGGNDHVVFAAHAEFAGDVDARLVG